MYKKILSVLICVLLLASSLCISVNAGVIGQEIGEFSEGLYTYDVEDNKAILKSCSTEASGEITVPATLGGYPVVTIAIEAFYRCDLITSIILPDSVETIEQWAFVCENLESIDLGHGVKTIEYSIFEGCEKLKTINIPKSVTHLDNSFFSGVGHHLESITVEEGNPNYYSINNCLIETATKKLLLISKNSQIPNDGSVENIFYFVFSDALEIKSANIPNGIKKIDRSSFICDHLEEIILPVSVSEIESHAIAGCIGLKYLTILNKTVTFADDAIINCDNLYRTCDKNTEGHNYATIRCYENSTAHAYAVANNIPVEFIVDEVETKTPEIIEGKNASYTQGSKNGLTIKSNADFKDFEAVLVDGKEIDKSNYTVTEGSTIVTLKDEYLATLSAGKHTIGIKSTTGIAETTFTVNSSGKVASATTTTTSPKTGDGVSCGFAVLLAISALALIVSKKKLTVKS